MRRWFVNRLNTTLACLFGAHGSCGGHSVGRLSDRVCYCNCHWKVPPS